MKYTFTLAAFVAALAACTNAVRAKEAEASYTIEGLRCVDAAKTRAEADACRAQQRARWDGGAAPLPEGGTSLRPDPWPFADGGAP